MDAPRPTPLSRVWSKNRIIAEDLTGEDLSDVLELHSDASAWWVLPRDDQYAAAELREVARALDLDQLAIKDLLANDHRVKYEEVGQARLVITSAVSVDYGPLSFSLRMGEKWTRYGDNKTWPEWEVFLTTARNYGLVLNERHLEKSFEIVHQPGRLPVNFFHP